VVRVGVLLVGFAAAVALAAPAWAAAPNYILVSGPGLQRPVLLGNWDENGSFLAALVDAPRAPRPPAGARRFDLAMFWGWGGRPRPTRPGAANQHGWFYPGHGARRAVVDAMVDGVRMPRIAPAATLRILARHRVPTRV
jgi:hypothetical protein